MKLNARQKIFVAAYIVERNGVRAALAAKFTNNPRSASVIATRMLANVSIREAIDKELRRQMDRIELKSDDVLKRIALIATDPTSKKFEALKADELLGKHFKLFTDVTEVTGKDGGPQVVAYIPDNGKAAKVAPKPKAKGVK